MESNSIEIKSIEECLQLDLELPPYQRPYKWSMKNIDDLLMDIETSISNNQTYTNLKYRLGTIILCKSKDGHYDIVDGQQRLISLSLINYYLDKQFTNSILKKEFVDKTTQINIHQNYLHIQEWFSLHKEMIKPFIGAMKNILEVVIIYVDKEEEAFQLFDSQNTRGKSLDPHDLLKAYHLREMRNDKYEMEYAVNKWENYNMNDIKELFGIYLFPIWNWSRGTKTSPFTDKEIDTYKGITLRSTYTYANRASKAMPYFQITEPFIAGLDFFEMVDHYLRLLTNLKTEISQNSKFEKIKTFCFEKHGVSVGLLHVQNLFFATILFYYDKFHNLDELSIKKIFMWAFMLRLDLHSLGADSVNKYAIGEISGNYSNHIGFFSKISLARTHSEISNVRIVIPQKLQSNPSDEQKELYSLLKEMSGQNE